MSDLENVGEGLFRLYRAHGNCGEDTRAFSPGYNIAGFQP